MKTAMRTVAVLSFGSFFTAGSCLIAVALPDGRDYVLAIAIGLFLIGVSLFAGAMIWLLAEKCFPRPDTKLKTRPERISP
ncbi:MAG: hypothetical protein EXS35_05180 [Pedosphaera sp.]|nr:hypothetical protein [Pedosphaera sp.]